MGLASHSIHSSASGWQPAYVSDNLCAMSIGFLLPSASSAVIWRGPKKNALIKQFLLDVDWTGGLDQEEDDLLNPRGKGVAGGEEHGKLDYMLIDTPPGTSDEHLSIVSLLQPSGLQGAILLTTPQEVSLQDVRKEISFCRKVNLPILGVVENMAGFVCPACHGRSDVFYPSTGGAKALCEELDLRFLGSVPLDPRIGRCCDEGESFVEAFPQSPAAKAYLDIIESESACTVGCATCTVYSGDSTLTMSRILFFRPAQRFVSYVPSQPPASPVSLATLASLYLSRAASSCSSLLVYNTIDAPIQCNGTCISKSQHLIPRVLAP